MDADGESEFPAHGWFPLEPRSPADVYSERLMRAVQRTAGSEELVWIDLPHYQNGHIAVSHLAGAKVPISVTLWMDDPADRMARIVRLGPQRHLLELRDADGIGVLENPTADQVARLVSAEERDVIEHDAISPAQIIIAALLAETHARIWLERAELPGGLRLRPWPHS